MSDPKSWIFSARLVLQLSAGQLSGDVGLPPSAWEGWEKRMYE
jgi:hypothetical protein